MKMSCFWSHYTLSREQASWQMNPHKKEESSFCSDSGWLCVWGPHSPSVDFSVWMAASRLSLKIPEKKRSNYAWGSTKYHGFTWAICRRSAGGSMVAIWLMSLDFCCLRLSMTLAVYRWWCPELIIMHAWNHFSFFVGTPDLLIWLGNLPLL